MKKKLLCVLVCMAMVLVACTGTRENTSSEKKKETKKETKKENVIQYVDQVKLGEYKGLELVKEIGSVEKADIENRINQILETSAVAKPVKEGITKEGDVLNIDYVGKIDGVPFDNGTAKGASIQLGNNNYIEGFDKDLYGKKIGEKVTIQVRFPDKYEPNPDLQGKDATFDITINYKEGEKVRPKWNDAFVRSVSEYNTTKEYEQQIRVELEQQLKQVEEDSFNAKILKTLTDSSECKKLPKDMVTSRKDAMINYYKDYAKQNNATYEEFIQGTFQMAVKDFEEKVKETSENSVKQTLVAFAIADKENLIPEGDKRVQMELEVAKKNNCPSVEKFNEMYGDEYALQLIVRDQVLDFVKKNGNITEKKVTAEDLAKEAQAQQ